jgi:hypothetical protein
MNYKLMVTAAFCVSLGLGFLVFSLSEKKNLAGSGEAEYALLVCDASYTDAQVAVALEGHGINGIIHEGGQTVLLDDFDTVIEVALDTYESRVFDFDPRNDGFAGELRAFFTDGSERRFFIPLNPQFQGHTTDEIKAKIEDALGAIQAKTIAIRQIKPPSLVFACLFAAAGIGTILFSPGHWLAALLLPPILPLILAGPSAFTLAVALFAIFRVLLEPVRGFFRSRRYKKLFPNEKQAGHSIAGINFSWVKTGKNHLWPALFTLVCTFIYGVICYINGIAAVTASLAYVSFIVMIFVAVFSESRQGSRVGHVRFVPVLIQGEETYSVRYPLLLFPFTLAAFLSVFASWQLTDTAGTAEFNNLTRPERVSAAGFAEHAAFQGAFSYRPLDGGEKPLLHYKTNESGLVIQSEPVQGRTPVEMVFPLETLLAFLDDNTIVYPYDAVLGDFLSAFIAMAIYVAFIIAVLGRQGKKSSVPFLIERQAAA